MNQLLRYILDEISKISSDVSIIGSSVYGDIARYSQNISTQSVSDGIFANNLTITYEVEEAGRYAIDWNFTANIDAPTAKIQARIQLNDTTELWTIRTPVISNDTGDRMPFSGFTNLSLDTGVNFFDLDFRNVGTGTVKVSQSRMRLIRIR